MNWRERTLLALTIVGFIVPNTMVALFAGRHGLTLDGYFRHWGGSLPAAQLALDMGIAFVAFALWAAWEGQRLRMRSWWVPVPASLLVGCASPFRYSCCCVSVRSASEQPRPRNGLRRWATQDNSGPRNNVVFPKGGRSNLPSRPRLLPHRWPSVLPHA
jgi:hypothetical protein